LYQIIIDPNHEPPRMMPKKFPDLTVEEQDDIGVFTSLNKAKL